MKRKELSQLYYLCGEIKMLEKRQEELKQALGETIGTTTVSGSSSSLPFSLHAISITGVEDKTRHYELKSELADVRSLLRLNREKCVCEYNRLNRYIWSIDDSMIRQILTYRFIDCMGWTKVAVKIGGGNTPDSVKKACTLIRA